MKNFINKVKNMELSKDQQKAYDAICAIRTGAVLLTGHAGCGKTFLATKIIENIIDKGGEVLCLAPTHQAKLQFANSIPSTVKLSTIASFLNVKAKKNDITGIVEFSDGFLDKSNKTSYNLIVIDECSMIGEEDLKELMKLSSKTLMVFLGDFNQLSPVKKKDGSEIFKLMKKFTLTEQHRNSGEILKLCDILRDSVYYPKKTTEQITVYDNRSDFLVSLINRIQDDPDPYNISYLAFTNKAVKEVRNLIHHVLYNDKVINEGQYLRLDSRTSIGNRSEIIEVIAFEKQTKILLDAKVDVYKILAENIFTAERATLNILSYTDQDIIEEIAQQYQSELFDLWTLHKNNPHKKEYKDKWKSLRELLNQLDDITMVTSPFALTVHKSQGRTIPTVFLDTQNIYKYGRDMTNKLLYVGCSRTKSDLNLIKI